MRHHTDSSDWPEFFERMLQFHELLKTKNFDHRPEVKEMCSKGRQMYHKFCADQMESEFLSHILCTDPEIGHCDGCYRPFKNLLWSVTENPGIIHGVCV